MVYHVRFGLLSYQFLGLFCPSLGLEGGHQALEYLAGRLVADGGVALGADLTGQLPDLVPNPAGDIKENWQVCYIGKQKKFFTECAM